MSPLTRLRRGFAMTLTPNMKTLLVAILEEVRRLEAVPDKPPPGA